MALKIKNLVINTVTTTLLALSSTSLMASYTLEQVGEYANFTPAKFVQARTDFGQSTLTPNALTSLATILAGHTTHVANLGTPTHFAAVLAQAAIAESSAGGGAPTNVVGSVIATDGDTVAGRERALLKLAFNWLSNPVAYTLTAAQTAKVLNTIMGVNGATTGPSILATANTTMTASNITWSDLVKYILTCQIK